MVKTLLSKTATLGAKVAVDDATTLVAAATTDVPCVPDGDNDGGER